MTLLEKQKTQRVRLTPSSDNHLVGIATGLRDGGAVRVHLLVEVLNGNFLLGQTCRPLLGLLPLRRNRFRLGCALRLWFGYNLHRSRRGLLVLVSGISGPMTNTNTRLIRTVLNSGGRGAHGPGPFTGAICILSNRDIWCGG